MFIDNVRLVYSTPGARAVQSSTDFANNDEFTVADMEVYPNPSGGRFTVDLLLPVATNSLQVELRDVTGRIVLRQQQSGYRRAQPLQPRSPYARRRPFLTYIRQRRYG